MKKLISFMLAIILLNSAMPVFCTEGHSFNASDCTSYFDSVGVGLESGNGNTSVILRGGEWIKFDMEGLNLTEGNYTVSLSQANLTENTANKKDLVFVDILVDDSLFLKKELMSTSTMNTFVNTEIGNIYVDNKTKYLTIKNSSFHELAYVDIEKVMLTKTDTKAFVNVTFAGLNTVSNISGEGYFDVAGADFWSNSFTPMGASVGSVMLHGTGDWAAYDISDLSGGMYELVVSSGERVQPSISILTDDFLRIEKASVNMSGAYGSYTDTNMGNIFISENSNRLVIRNNAQATEIRSITLKKISDGLSVSAADCDEYYDNSGNALETNESRVVLRNGEWIRFDSEKLGLSYGNYLLSVKYKNVVNGKNAAFLDVLTGEKLTYKNEISASNNVTEKELGVIQIYEKDLMLKNSACHSDSALELASFTLTPTDKAYSGTYTFNAFNIFSDINGEGYSDAAGADFWETKESENGLPVTSVTTAGGSAVLHSGDSVTYDISALKSGTYSFKILSSERYLPIIEITVDGKKYFEGVSLSVGGGYGAPYETYTFLDNIYIDDNAEKITFKNLSNATYLRSFTLQKFSDTATDSKEFELAYDDVLKTDYYDEAGIEFSDYDFSRSGCILLDKNDWVKYTVSGVPAGNYILYAYLQSDGARVTFDSDGETVAENVKITESNLKYRKFDKIRVGELNISSESQFLKVENSSEDNKQVLIRKLVLKSVTETEGITYSLDAEGTIEVSSVSDAESVYLTGKIESFDGKDDSFGVLLTSALYKNGMLVDLICSNQAMEENFSVKLPSDSSVDLSEVDLIKTFVWDCDLKPYGTEKILYSGEKTHIYVSADNGNDLSGDGSEEMPFKTIGKAQEKVREINENMKGDIIVHLKGEFVIDEPLRFVAEDSGFNGFSVVYDGEEGASVSGGKKITEWEQITDTQLFRAKVDGVDDFRQFYINGNRGARAKSKFLYKPKAVYSDGVNNYVNNTIDGFIVDGSDFDGEFSNPDDIEFVWQPSWKNIRMPVSNITKTEDEDYLFTFSQPYFDSTLLTEGDGMPKPDVDTPFYIENAREFLDEQGEWFFDKNTKWLYYYPMENENMSEAECYIPISEQLISVKGESDREKVKNLTFKNVTFSYGAWNVPSEKGFITHQAESLITADASVQNPDSYSSGMISGQIEVEYADNISFISNEFSHLGSVAVFVSNKTTNALIKGNLFDDISASAIVLGDSALEKNIPKEDLCSEIDVSDNLIRRTSVEYQTPIITAYHLRDSSIKNNDILDAPYTGISIGWGWGSNVENSGYNDVSCNKIENVMYRLHDGGHIYSLGKQTGTVISGNYLIKSEDYHGGVYLDNSSSEITVRDNVFEECPKWIRMLWHNVTFNVGRNNYSNRSGSILNPNEDVSERNNDFEEAISYDSSNAEVNKIKLNAGLSDEYKSLLSEYEKKSTEYRNDALKWLKYDTDAGINVPAGDYMEGGEGVAYHDISEVQGGLSDVGEPGIVSVGGGINHKYITMTGQGEWTKYKVEITEEGEYDFYLTFVSLGYQYVNIYIDDELVVNRKLLNKSADNYNDILHTLTEQQLATINLTEGEHTIKIEHAISNFVPYKFRLNKVGDIWQGRNDGFDENILNAMK